MSVKIGESVAVSNGAIAGTYSAGTTYNGVADASGIGIDTKDYNEALVVLNMGATTSNGTVDVTVRSDTVNSANASSSDAISGATFTQITTDNDNACYVGNINLRDVGRYLFVKSVVANQNADFGISVILSKADSVPTSQTLTFDV